MQELQKNDHYKVISIEIPAGTNMPMRFCTSETFVIVESGNALLICKDETCELTRGSNFSIPAREPYLLKIIEDFKAYIISASDALITYALL